MPPTRESVTAVIFELWNDYFDVSKVVHQAEWVPGMVARTQSLYLEEINKQFILLDTL